jgi:hypothetical protein
MAIKVGGTTVIDNTRNLTNISNLTATGDATITGNATMANLTATGNATMANLTATGNATIADLTATGNATMANLTASGDVEVSNLTASGNVKFSGTGAITLPAGTTAQQPTVLSAGQLRFNTERNKAEIYDGTKFGTVGGEGGGGGVVDYVVADSSLSTYIVKQFEIIENNFTPSGTWQIKASEDGSAVLMVLEVPSIDETGEYFEETTTVNTNHVFFDTLNIFAEAVITIASGKIMQGVAGIGTAGVSSGAVAVDKMQSIGKIYYLNSI